MRRGGRRGEEEGREEEEEKEEEGGAVVAVSACRSLVLCVCYSRPARVRAAVKSAGQALIRVLLKGHPATARDLLVERGALCSVGR